MQRRNYFSCSARSLLWINDYLALHLFVAAAAQFAASECVSPRLGRHDANFHHFALFQFPAILAIGERQPGRGVHFGASWECADADPVRLVRGRNIQFDSFVDLHVDDLGLEIEILGRHADNSGRLFTLRLCFLA